jgi:peroxiredoxin
MAELDNFKLKIGDTAPAFNLPGVDGNNHGIEDYSGSPLLLVVFSCNHCPYAIAWEGRLISLAREYASKGLATVVINSNETENYPADSFEHMVERSKEKAYPFPYLRDESQEVAKAYGALVTPHAFLFGQGGPKKPSRRQLVFQGRIDDNWEDPSRVKKQFLRDAIEAALKGKSVPTPTTSVQGCSIKWRMS